MFPHRNKKFYECYKKLLALQYIITVVQITDLHVSYRPARKAARTSSLL